MRKLILPLVSFLLICLSVKAQVNLQNGLVAFYPFNGNANDESTNANNGVAYGATLTTDRFGNQNSAYSFDGINDYIAIPDMPSLRINGSLSLNVWVNINNIQQDNARILMKEINSFSPWISYGITTGFGSSKKFTFEMSNTPYCMSPDPIISNNWVMLTAIYDLSYKKLYINNLLVSSTPVTNALIQYSSTGLYIGGDYPRSIEYIKGNIDDIRIYDRVLNDTEIRTLYNEGICYQSISVTDTLVINALITNYNPITYQNSIKIFPNPTKDHLNIDFGNNFNTLSGYSFKITNNLGLPIYEGSINKRDFSISFSSFSEKGLFIIQLIDSANKIIDTKKIILN